MQVDGVSQLCGFLAFLERLSGVANAPIAYIGGPPEIDLRGQRVLKQCQRVMSREGLGLPPRAEPCLPQLFLRGLAANQSPRYG